MNQPNEHDIQCAFIDWCRLNETRLPGLRLAFAVPNGGMRNKIVAAKLKAEGVRAGVLDWLCPVPVAGFNGLAIEFKRGNNGMTKSQQEFAELLEKIAGWHVSVCFSSEEGIRTVERYFNAN